MHTRAPMSHPISHAMETRPIHSVKWNRYPSEVVPLWVADMDFRCPEPVLRALHERVDQGMFGYGFNSGELAEVIPARLRSRYGWRVSTEDIVFLPGVVPGINLACRAATQPGDAVLIQVPVYAPIRKVAAAARCTCHAIQFVTGSDGRVEIDWDAFGVALRDRTRVFVLCNPQNPTGRVFSREELARMATACVEHGVTVISDEIHCDLLVDQLPHVPIASLGDDIARRTVTLMAPSKTFNLAGLQCAFAIIQNPELRARFQEMRTGLVPHVNALGMVAAVAAFRDGQAWLEDVLEYLVGNREVVARYVRDELPGVSMAAPEGTHLAWLNCRESAARERPYEYFLQKARVALSDGSMFGPGGDGFVRLNFACHRSTLIDALDRMVRALAAGEILTRETRKSRSEREARRRWG